MSDSSIHKHRSRRGVIQNIGWLERSIRVIVGLSLFILPSYLLEFDYIREASWEYYAILFSIVPLLTGAIGWCPFYSLFGVRTCGGSEKNPCGTFPFEVDAALGHHPIPANDDEHSLANSRHLLRH